MPSHFSKFNKEQRDKLSDIYSGVGFVMLTSIAIPALLDHYNLIVILLGGAGTIILFILSIWLKK